MPRSPTPSETHEDIEIAEDSIELYVDSAQVRTGLFGSTVYLGTQREGQQALVKAIIKVSPQMLKVLGLIINKHSRGYEGKFGAIGLPNALLQGLGLEEEISG